MTLFQARTVAADAPKVETGMADLRFDGVTPKTIKGGQFQKNPNGDPKLEWEFTVLDDEGAEIYDEGEPVVVNTLTGVGFNVVSKTVPQEVRILKALMTPAEYESFISGEGFKAEDLFGRVVQGEIYIKDSGYPGVTNIIAARKRRAAKAPAGRVESEE